MVPMRLRISKQLNMIQNHVDDIQVLIIAKEYSLTLPRYHRSPWYSPLIDFTTTQEFISWILLLPLQ